MKLSSIAIKAFELVTPDLMRIHEEAIRYSLSDWKGLQKTLVVGSGAAAAAIPGYHILGIGADAAFLMNRMAVCSYGIGSILGRNSYNHYHLEEEDFAFVLAKWSGVEGTENAVIAKVAADLVAKVGNKEAARMLAKAMCQNAGILIGKKISSKVGIKLGAKFGTKLGGKLAGGMLPLIGAAISGGVNYWFIDEIAGAAEHWYKLKIAV